MPCEGCFEFLRSWIDVRSWLFTSRGHGALFPEEGKYNDGVFNVCAKHGFLPSSHPDTKLPVAFQGVQDIIDAMPIWLKYAEDGTGVHGLLHTPGALPDAVGRMSNYIGLIHPLTMEKDAKLIHILFRAYAFLASAYLLEPAYASSQTDTRSGRLIYGAGISKLPVNIAQPFCAVAEKLGQHPYLEYHYAYALGNYRLLDPTLKPEYLMHYKNLGMACSFSGTPDEVGFIQLHTHIVSHTGAMLGCMGRGLDAAERRDVASMRHALKDLSKQLELINATRRLMWEASRHERYNDFRIFIMGIRGNTDVFGDGVVYEGVDKYKGEPQSFMGQTGAQDDTIPTCDIFSGVIKYYPENALTEALQKFREYRPVVVQKFFKDLEKKVESSDMLGFVKEDPESCAWLASVVDQIYHFRNGHWQFVQKYIMVNTDHPVATGGTPVIYWLPNQIGCCLEYLQDLIDLGSGATGESAEMLKTLAQQQAARVSVLEKQVRSMEDNWSRCGSFGAENVIDLNRNLMEGTDEELAAKGRPSMAGCPFSTAAG